jgi:signal peptidase I
MTKEKFKKEIIEWIFCFVIAYIIYLFINYFIGTISGVKQVSMKPTVNDGERVLISRTIFNKKELKRGDIITFISPDYENNNIIAKEIKTIEKEDAIAKYIDRNYIDSFFYYFIGYGKRSFIKRVIGVPGDHIKIDLEGNVYLNENILEEPYLKDVKTTINGNFTDVIVPENSVFVMGDNRLQSMDSRSFGCIPLDKIDGYVISRVWPLDKIENIK